MNGRQVVWDDNGTTDRRLYVRLPLRAGRNLVGFRVTAGRDGWMVSLAKGAFVPAAEAARAPAVGVVSIYRGPVLLAYDARFNAGDFFPERVPHLVAPALELRPAGERAPADPPWILVEGRDADGHAVRYCDFASAGATGNYYTSWVPVRFHCPEVEFSRANPRRSLVVARA